MKSIIVRGNNKPHMNKTLRKAIMRRSHLKKVFNRSKHPNDWNTYKKQRNLVTNLNKQARKIYFDRAVDNINGTPKDFWKLCKPFLSDNIPNENRILIVEDNNVICNENDTAEIFNVYFNGIIQMSLTSNHGDQITLLVSTIRY